MVLKKQLTISSWNVHGLYQRINGERSCKLDDDEFVSNIKSDIVCLLETKCDKEDNISIKNYQLLKKVLRPRKGKGIYGP